MTARDGDWLLAAASTRGSAHDRTGAPNQDAHAAIAVEGPNAGVIVAVADGHGGAAYVRSGRGSKLAVRIATDLAREAAKRLLEPPGEAANRAFALQGLAPRIVDAWRAAVLDDLRNEPLTADEDRLAADAGDDPVYAYGATLLLAVLTVHARFVLQLGDGDALVIGGDGRTTAPVPGDDRLTGGQTTSLCLPDAASDFRFAVVPDGAEVVVLASDGYGNSFADPDWATTVGLDLIETIRDQGFTAVEAALPGWLVESARMGGDDVTVTVMARRPPSAAPTLGVPVMAPAASSRRSSRRGPLLAVVALLVAGGVGALAWSHDDDPAVTSASSTPPITSTSTNDSGPGASATATTRPATTRPSAPATAVPATSVGGVDASSTAVRVADRDVIEFSNDREEPSPIRRSQTPEDRKLPAFGTKVAQGTTSWAIDGGVITKSAGGDGASGATAPNAKPIPLDPSERVTPTAFIIAPANGTQYLWVITADLRALFRVDLDDDEVQRYEVIAKS